MDTIEGVSFGAGSSPMTIAISSQALRFEQY